MTRIDAEALATHIEVALTCAPNDTLTALQDTDSQRRRRWLQLGWHSTLLTALVALKLALSLLGLVPSCKKLCLRMCHARQSEKCALRLAARQG